MGLSIRRLSRAVTGSPVREARPPASRGRFKMYGDCTHHAADLIIFTWNRQLCRSISSRNHVSVTMGIFVLNIFPMKVKATQHWWVFFYHCCRLLSIYIKKSCNDFSFFNWWHPQSISCMLSTFVIFIKFFLIICQFLILILIFF